MFWEVTYVGIARVQQVGVGTLVYKCRIEDLWEGRLEFWILVSPE